MGLISNILSEKIFELNDLVKRSDLFLEKDELRITYLSFDLCKSFNT